MTSKVVLEVLMDVPEVLLEVLDLSWRPWRRFWASMYDGKRPRSLRRALGVAFHCAPARPPEARRGGLGGRIGSVLPGALIY